MDCSLASLDPIKYSIYIELDSPEGTNLVFLFDILFVIFL